MKKAAVGAQNHAKPFIVAIGIAFTFLALVVIYVAFTKGGLDIRSRAGLIAERCYTATKTLENGKTKYFCPSNATQKNGSCCYRMTQVQQQVLATPTPVTCKPGMAGCVVKNGQLMQIKTTAKPTPAPTKMLIQVTQKVMATPAPTKTLIQVTQKVMATPTPKK